MIRKSISTALAVLMSLGVMSPACAQVDNTARGIAIQARNTASSNTARMNAPGVLGTGLIPLSARVNWPLANISGQPTTTYRIRYVLPKGGRNIRLVYFGGYGTNGNSTECLTPSNTSFSFSAGIEYPQGAEIQSSFNGTNKPTVTACQFIVSDPISVNVPPGGTIWVRSTGYQTGSTIWPGAAFTQNLSGNNGQDGDGAGYRVTNATNVSPIVISGTGAHNLSTGDTVQIVGCTGNTAANGTWTITTVATTSFSLNGSTGNGTFTGGCNILGADFSTPGAGQITTAGGTNALAPVAVIGDPYSINDTRVWASILLDSIARGSGETAQDGGGGWISRGLGGPFSTTFPHINIAIPGLTSAQFANLTTLAVASEKRRRLALSAPYLINNGGTNDLTTGATWQQIAGYNLAIASDAKLQGSRVVQATITPKTTSTDSWATTVNQTPATSEAARIAYNQWLRAGAPILNGVAVSADTAGAIFAGSLAHPFWKTIDPASLIEVNAANVPTVDGGRWATTGVANYPTTDGTHPTSAYHIILSAAVSAIVPQMVAF